MHNKKNIIKWALLMMCTIIAIIPITIVFANNSGSTTGGSSDTNYTGGWKYMFNGSTGDGHGLRMSLYTYDGTNLTYHSSVDFCTGAGCFNGKTAATFNNMAGRIAYENGKTTLATSLTDKKITVNSQKFSCYNGPDCSYVGAVDSEISAFFGFGSNGNYDTIKTNINSVFGTNLEDLSNGYVTIEPTIFFYECENYAEDADGKGFYFDEVGNHISCRIGKYFYGTTYEFMKSGLYDDYSGMENVLGKDSANAIKASSASADDLNCFVGTSNCASSLVSLVGSGDSDAQNPVKGLSSKKGYGINVIWLGDGSYVPPKNCLTTCSGNTGDSLLSCAEAYCQEDSTDSETKKACISSCGYSDPGFSSCGNTTDVDGKDTVCDEETTAYDNSCIGASANGYFKTVCTEESTIKYGNSLPVTVNAGLGFSYTPTVSGSKTCEMVFDADKWKFDYASAYTDAERNNLLNILNRYNNVSDTSIWAQDINDKYKYKSNNANIEIEITNNNDASVTNRKTVKKLIAGTTINLLDRDIKISSAGTVSVPLYANGTSNNKTIFEIVRTTSSNKTAYKLPGVCINNGVGTLYELGPSGRCNSLNEGPYYKYYTDLSIEKGTYDTKTFVSKTSSNLSVNNTCNYSVNIPVSCSIALVDCVDGIPTKAELRIENKNNLNISYGLSSSGYVLNGVKTLDISNSIKKLYGAIGIDGQIVTTCNRDLSALTCDDPDPDPNPNPIVPEPDPNPVDPSSYNCTKNYKPSEYDKINEYCTNNWMNDVANYSSEKDCYNSCSTGTNTCKNNPEVDTNNIASVTAFCSIKQNRDDNGYNKANSGNPITDEQHNIAICINDCMNLPKDNECLGIACDYLYRPISLKDPFPNNRNAGYNWYGKEIFITDDLLNPVLNKTSEPEYVIELTPDVIDSINRQTDSYNDGKNKNAYIDYVFNDGENKNGKYVSKFIHSSDIENGGFGLYFTKILD